MPTVEQSVEEAEQRVQRGVAKLAEYEQQWHDGKIKYELLAAATQALEWERSVLDACNRRALKRAEEASEAAQKEATEKRLKSEATAKVKRLDAQIMAAENLASAIVSALDVCRKHKQPDVPFVLGVALDTLITEATGQDMQSVSAIKYALQQTPGPKMENVLKTLRKQRTNTKQKLESNGKVNA